MIEFDAYYFIHKPENIVLKKQAASKSVGRVGEDVCVRKRDWLQMLYATSNSKSSNTADTCEDAVTPVM